jgi:hypothetical protein
LFGRIAGTIAKVGFESWRTYNQEMEEGLAKKVKEQG